MDEPEVIRRTRGYLHTHGLLGRRVRELYTDAHPSLLPARDLEPFQRFTLQFDAFATHPDLVGRLDDGGTQFAVEAKGSGDWLKGIAQADTYRQGFHAVLVAVAGAPSADMAAFARQRGIGVLAVQPAAVELLAPPLLHLPRLDLADGIRRQFTAGDTLARLFSYNVPTHYLACAACLAEWESLRGRGPVALGVLEPFIRERYPAMPALPRPALAGAEKLGLAQMRGGHAELTRLGRTCAGLLPSPPELSAIHAQAVRRPLAEIAPQAAAVLRILLDREPIARFLTDVLASLGPGQPIAMPGLVLQASQIDRALTPTVFFFPDAIAELLDDQGFLVWRRVEPRHYRTSIYMQYKRILTHAGLLRDHGAGGTTSRSYRPDDDLWELR